MESQVVGGRYELVAELGAGGMGQVYEGFDRHLKRRIAVKFTHPGLDQDPDWTRRFFQEAELMASLGHPGLPTLHDAGVVSGQPDRPYLVMEYIDGVTFQELLDNRGPLPVGVVASLGAQTAAVLAATHRNRVYHRDLKPSNLMLRADGTVKVLDFGLAIAPDSNRTRLTTTGHTLGTPAFMAPEQVEGGTVVPQTDLYALGLVLYELLTGDRVMTGSSPYVVWSNQVHLVPADIRDECPDVPGDLADLIMSMLAKSPGDRPDSALTVHTVLMRHAGGLESLREVDDVQSPALMYALAVGAGTSSVSERIVPSHDDVPAESSENATAVIDFSRGDLERAVRRARSLTDTAHYDAVIHELTTLVGAAVPVLGPRDADVVEARIRLAELRFENADYARAAELFHSLIDDLTAERGPYDDQVMRCQRHLANCEVFTGEFRSALARLERLQIQMEARYGEDDPRVAGLSAEIDHLRANRQR